MESPRESLFDMTVAKFLDGAGAAVPTPGGGSVAAVAAALGISMAKMAANYTIGRKRFADREPAVRALVDKLDRADAVFRDLAGEDIAAYQAYTDASKLDRDDPDRAQRLDEALTLATMVPTEMTALAVATLATIHDLKDAANPRLLSDLGVAATLVEAAARSAALNVRVNLAEMPDKAEVAERRAALDKQLARGADQLKRIDAFLAERF